MIEKLTVSNVTAWQLPMQPSALLALLFILRIPANGKLS